MTVLDLRFHAYRYFPYERRLAELEVERFFGVEPKVVNESLRVQTLNGVDPRLLERLTYFQQVVGDDKGIVIPQQARLEASATDHDDPRRLRRQHTRYSAHGLHEYRGKFNPQVVRISMNLLGLESGSRVWDPFCGSGTVPLEALHQGFNALGVDLNPLAVLIANAKLAAVRARPESLERAADAVIARVQRRWTSLEKRGLGIGAIERFLGSDWANRFGCSEYLARWFPMPVLAQFSLILDSIDELAPASLRGVFRVVLSDIARQVSWQDPGDLRIRRRKDPAPNYAAVQLFVTALRDRVGTIVAARGHVSPRGRWQRAFEGDSCCARSLPAEARRFLRAGVDCVLSSPPYATALPYIDTQRLSIALLGLASPQQIRHLDAALVGSREISTRQRLELEAGIQHNTARLAPAAWQLCKDLKGAYDPAADGFRRQNTPAVVYRYFAGMTRAMGAAKQSLKRGGSLVFIIGPSRTRLGGAEYLIDTPTLLAATGRHLGLEPVEMHELDAYSRYDVHSRNSIREEQLLMMRRL